MKIAIVAANGKAGKLIASEAVNRGIEVTAIVRSENRSSAPTAIIKDALSLTKDDLADFDVVIDAVGGWTADSIGAIPDVAKHLGQLLAGTKTRLLVVGGAGSLFVNPEHTVTVADAPSFPSDWKPLAAAHAEALAALRAAEGLNWTYVSPACDFRADEPRTGEYKLGGEELTLSSNGDSVIGYADYAVAMIDEALSNAPHIAQRISVVRKGESSNDDIGAINQLLANYVESVNKANIDLAASIWATDSNPVFIHPRGTERGWNEVAHNFYGITMGETFSKRDLQLKDVSVEVFGDTALAIFFWDFYATVREDSSLLETHGRETQLLRKIDGAWRIAHVHYSNMPITGKLQGF